MSDPRKLEAAIRRVRDQQSFIQELLVASLGWPLDEAAAQVEDIAFDWSAADLRAKGLDRHMAEGTIRQLQPVAGNPWGVFLVEFRHPEVFTTGRGMTGPLRGILRGLVPSKRKQSDLASFKREHLLFICTHGYQHYRFAYFKSPPKGAGAGVAPLAAFGWGPGDPIRTLCEFNLPALVWPEPPCAAAAWVAAWAEAFDVEKVTKRFYEDYAAVFAQVEGAIGKTKELKGDELRLYTQTLFNRLMFLRFIERKGWLEFQGRHDYLRALFAAEPIRGKSFYKGRLQPLFFEGLAVEGKQESEAIGHVPFLNGGLFEQSDLDRKVKDLPDQVFAAIIAADGLFYRYNFTVEESTPSDIEVAVDPEMLGKVFEELVTGRHESGSYYTPRPVVSFMCREALKGVLTDKTGAKAEAIKSLVDGHQARGLRETHAREVLQALDDLKAVDPACGSGAYLLGLLHEMVSLYRLLYSEKLTRDARSLYELKLRIISHNLYGVDIDAFATNIAMLRLWLSLAVEADEPVPLPNLDFKIETGDSLLAPDPQEMPDLFRGLLQAEANALVNMKGQFLKSHGREKEQYRDQIRRTEWKLRTALSEHYGESVVDWRVQFPEAFSSGERGFDVVVANPPYVRQEMLDGAYKQRLLELYGAAVEGKSDLYCYFYVRGLQSLRKNGMHVFVCSNSWLDVGFGARLQSHLLAHSHIQAIYDSAVERQFSTADINTIITVIQKARSPFTALTYFVSLRGPFDLAIHDPTLQRRVERTHEQLDQDLVPETNGKSRRGGKCGKWGGKYLRAPDVFFAFLRTERPMCALGTELRWSFGRGRRTGCDEFFYLTSEELSRWKIEPSFIRPLVKSPTDFRACAPRTSALGTGLHVFLCHKDKAHLRGTRALRYIMHGEELEVHRRNVNGAGGRWYDLGPQPNSQLILPIAFNERFFVVLNDAAAEVHQRFATVIFQPGSVDLVKPVAALLSSSLIPLMAEVLGRRSLGQGVLDFPPEDWREVMIPDPTTLSDNEKRELTHHWEMVSRNPPRSLAAATKTTEYRELDATIARILSFDEQFIEQVRVQAVEMVAARLRKATSVARAAMGAGMVSP